MVSNIDANATLHFWYHKERNCFMTLPHPTLLPGLPIIHALETTSAVTSNGGFPI
jgi:hypothetical protein